MQVRSLTMFDFKVLKWWIDCVVVVENSSRNTFKTFANPVLMNVL
jgi:hypothetical protein